MHKIVGLLAPLVLVLGSAAQASALTFTLDAEITGSSVSFDPAGPVLGSTDDLPPIGTVGTVTLRIPDGLPSDLEIDRVFGGGSEVLAVFNFPNLLFDVPSNDGTIVNESGLFAAGKSAAFFGSGPTGSCCSGFSAASFEFGSSVTSAPTTYGELIATLSAPGLSGTADNEFQDDLRPVSYRIGVRFPPDVPAVPLPATLPLLLGGLGGVAALRRRRG